MPAYGECGIYDPACREQTCDHVTNPKRVVPEPVYVMDIITRNGVPFRVVYGVRNDIYGKPITQYGKVVSFYDRRHKGTEYGQFVSDYTPKTLSERNNVYGLNLYGSVDGWSVDWESMALILDWLTGLKAF